MSIDAKLVKLLRDKTGAGMMDCKNALTEPQGDIEAAVDWLRTKGLATAAKKAGRLASEGLIVVVADGTGGAIVEVNSETDFVARNQQFQDFVNIRDHISKQVDDESKCAESQEHPDADKALDHIYSHKVPMDEPD